MGQTHVDTIKEFKEEDPIKAWIELAIEDKHKKNIQAMASAHFNREAKGERGNTNIQDLIPGKGKGLVILLHSKSS
jgi:hypothetical protein